MSRVINPLPGHAAALRKILDAMRHPKDRGRLMRAEQEIIQTDRRARLTWAKLQERT